MKTMKVNIKFNTNQGTYKPGEVYITTDANVEILQRVFKRTADERGKPKFLNTAVFSELDTFIPRANKKGNFNNLVIMRAGGIGDLIALTSIIDYFENKNVFLLTQKKKYEALFEWFENKPEIYELSEPFQLTKPFKTAKSSNWARLEMEGLIERGHQRNWFELFFSFIEENEPEEIYLRPQLIDERINDNPSNIQKLGNGKPSLLICNKATAMMRTCHASDITLALPKEFLDNWQIFVYKNNLSKDDLELIPLYERDIKIIEDSSLADFLLDVYDADQLISVDSGALHFREGVCKPGIGIYNSFTADSRTKYYQYTKSFNVISTCHKQPCFLHETIAKPFCEHGDKEMFAAPCFDSGKNDQLHQQLSIIFKNNL